MELSIATIHISNHWCCIYGNTVVLKPSEHSPNTSKILEKIINESFERGHGDVVNGGPEIGKYLLNLNGIIFFSREVLRLEELLH